MPRTIQITWKDRVSLFKTYRKRRKILPVAKELDVARSTVSAVVNRFKEAGFSDGPRLKASQDTLTRLQQRHLDGVISALKSHKPPTLPPPEEYTSLVGEKFALVQKGAMAVSCDLMWHLKGTDAEKLLSEADQALSDYKKQCEILWRTARTALEERCGIPVTEYVEDGETPDDSRLWNLLIDAAYGGLFKRSFALDGHWADVPVSGVDKSPHAKSYFRGGQLVAVLYDLDVERFFEGVKKYDNDAVTPLKKSASGLARLFQDLQYLQAFVQSELECVSDENIKAGVCPACPFPEAEL